MIFILHSRFINECNNVVCPPKKRKSLSATAAGAVAVRQVCGMLLPVWKLHHVSLGNVPLDCDLWLHRKGLSLRRIRKTRNLIFETMTFLSTNKQVRVKSFLDCDKLNKSWTYK